MARDDPLVAAAFSHLGRIRTGEWPMVAAWLLASGFDGPALATMAALDRSATGWDVDPLVVDVLREINAPETDNDQAAHVLGATYATAAPAGTADHLVVRVLATVAPHPDYPGGSIGQCYYAAEFRDCGCDPNGPAHAHELERTLRDSLSPEITPELADILTALNQRPDPHPRRPQSHPTRRGRVGRSGASPPGSREARQGGGTESQSRGRRSRHQGTAPPSVSPLCPTRAMTCNPSNISPVFGDSAAACSQISNGSEEHVMENFSILDWADLVTAAMAVLGTTLAAILGFWGIRIATRTMNDQARLSGIEFACARFDSVWGSVIDAGAAMNSFFHAQEESIEQQLAAAEKATPNEPYTVDVRDAQANAARSLDRLIEATDTVASQSLTLRVLPGLDTALRRECLELTQRANLMQLAAFAAQLANQAALYYHKVQDFPEMVEEAVQSLRQTCLEHGQEALADQVAPANAIISFINFRFDTNAIQRIAPRMLQSWDESPASAATTHPAATMATKMWLKAAVDHLQSDDNAVANRRIYGDGWELEDLAQAAVAAVFGEMDKDLASAQAGHEWAAPDHPSYTPVGAANALLLAQYGELLQTAGHARFSYLDAAGNRVVTAK